jgi:hypothetical protein
MIQKLLHPRLQLHEKTYAVNILISDMILEARSRFEHSQLHSQNNYLDTLSVWQYKYSSISYDSH